MLEAVPVQPDLPGWWDLFPEHLPASPTPPPASSSFALTAQVNSISSEPCFGPACGCCAPGDAFPWENVFAAPGAHPLCHSKCSLWEFPGQRQNHAAGFGPL